MKVVGMSQRKSKNSIPGFPHGLCFIGAMNHDLVCQSKMPRAVRSILQESYSGRTIEFSETTVSDADNERIVSLLPMEQCRSELGGSGFNAVRAASLLRSVLRLGFVGVVGKINSEYPHLDFLKDRSVETTFVSASPKPCACSTSFSYDGDRTLLTAIGANMEAGTYFSDKRSEIASYLQSYSTVHVTSFLDDFSTRCLAGILEDAILSSPQLKISVDPGSVWVSQLSEAIESIISSATTIHLNEREFSTLGGRLRDEDEKLVVVRIANMMRQGPKTIVLRKHKSVTIYDVNSTDVRSMLVENRILLSDSEVIDATGAGDTLTGLLLAAMEADVIRSSLAASFAMNVTVEKLRHSGAVNIQDLERGFRSKIGPFEPSKNLRYENEEDDENA